MASGRPDYWIRVMPTRVLVSQDQTLWAWMTSKVLVAGEDDYTADYEVEAGYKLVITGGQVCSDHPGIKRFALNIRGANVDYFHFDQIYIFSSDDSGLYELAAGEKVKGYINNLDNCQNVYNMTLRGYLEKV